MLRNNALNGPISEQAFFLPSFLGWLDRFPGIWERAGVGVEIDRRSDGALAARGTDGTSLPLIDLLSGNWQKIEPTPGPLGFRPVILSEGLVSLWLGPEVAKTFRYAMFVSSGPRILLRRIENAIREESPEGRELKWLSWWIHNAEKNLEPMSPEDIAIHQKLFDCFLRERA